MALEALADLIARVGFIIDDPRPGSTFTDQDIAAALAQRRFEVRYMPLRELPTFSPAGGVSYSIFEAPFGWWDRDARVYDPSYNDITAQVSTVDFLVGRWEFSTPRSALPVLVTGFHYDVYAAAADLLEVWASKVKMKVDFAADGQSVQLSQQYEHLLDRARELRRRGIGSTLSQASMYRSDLEPSYEDRC